MKIKLYTLYYTVFLEECLYKVLKVTYIKLLLRLAFMIVKN
jgi:hypothetical protein